MHHHSSQLPPFTGWRLARPVVCTGRSIGDLDLSDLTRRAALLDRSTPIDQHLHHLHLASLAVASALLAPWVGDGATLSVLPTQLGIRPVEGVPNTVWVSDVRVLNSTPDMLGYRCADLLAPLIAEIALRSGRHELAVGRLAQDRLTGEIERLRRHVSDHVSDRQVTAFLAGFGVRPRPSRHVAVEPDAGPPVNLRIPNVCCVLHTVTHPDACPTCPRRPDDHDRVRASADWLRSLDDANFHALTGRARLERDEPAPRDLSTPTVES